MNKLILTILLLLFCNTVFADIFKKIEVKGLHGKRAPCFEDTWFPGDQIEHTLQSVKFC